jgi:hypothetical protein
MLFVKPLTWTKGSCFGKDSNSEAHLLIQKCKRVFLSFSKGVYILISNMCVHVQWCITSK